VPLEQQQACHPVPADEASEKCDIDIQGHDGMVRSIVCYNLSHVQVLELPPPRIEPSYDFR
jgi:hypothetical protein